MKGKKVILRSIVSLSAAKAAWEYIGREFKCSDALYGDVGLISTIGRLGIKATGTVLAYVLVDAGIEWLCNAGTIAFKEGVGAANDGDGEDPVEDTEPETVDEDSFEEEDEGEKEEDE